MKIVIEDNVMRKMLIQVDANKISERSAKKLNMILSHYEMELAEDGWYTGTEEHCKSVYVFVTRDNDILNNLIQFIYWNPETGIKEDCKKEYLKYREKQGYV